MFFGVKGLRYFSHITGGTGSWTPSASHILLELGVDLTLEAYS